MFFRSIAHELVESIMPDECSPFTIGVFIFVLAGVDARNAGPAPNCLKAYSVSGCTARETATTDIN